MIHGGGEDAAPGRWRMLALVSVATLLGMSLWFAATAVAAQLRARWGLDAAGTGWLTAVVQLGFVVGTATAAILNLADVWPPHRFFGGCAALAALANLGLIAAPDFRVALASRFFTGLFLAGVYPPALKMIATWFRAGRGLAIGTVVGAITAGSAMPYLVNALGGVHVDFVVVSTSAGAAAAALLMVAGFREGPYPFPRRAFSWRLAGAVLRDRETRLAIGGYLGHMWELYAMWTWLPSFLAASLAVGHGAPPASALVNALAFGGLAIGGLGSVWGGWMAPRWGYAKVVTVSMAISGACALAIGFFYGASPWLLAPMVWLWGFFVVSDSAQFSAMVTETAPPHAVGTALTLQTSLGFLLTMVTIQLVPRVVDLAGWRWAFTILALGPAAGIAAIARIGARR
jgi:MFS family permease